MSKTKNILIVIVVALSFFLCSSVFCQESTSGETEEFDFANGLFSRGMYDMAISGYKDFLKKYPKSQYSETAGFRMAECYFLSGKHKEAIEEFDEALKRSPSRDMKTKILLRKGQAYYMLKDYKKAKEMLSGLDRKGVGEENDMFAAKYYLSAIYFQEGDYVASKKRIEDLLSELKEGEYAAFAYINLGDIHTQLKDDKSAADAYGKAASLVPDNDVLVAQASFRAGQAYHKAGDHRKAKMFYQKALNASNKKDIIDNSAIGLLSSLHAGGETGLIIETGRGLLSRVSDENTKAQILFIIGNRLFSEDRLVEAEKTYSESANLYPDTEFGLRARLNQCWLLYNMGKYDQCLDVLNTYLNRTKSKKDEAMYIKAKALVKTGRMDDALKMFRQIIKEYKNSKFHKEAMYDIGWLYEEKGDLAAAVSEYRAFIKAYPDDTRSPSVFLKAAQEAFRAQNYTDAEKGYLDFLKRFKDSPFKENVLYQLGRTYLEKGDNDKAIEVYERFIKEFPDSEARKPAVFDIANAYQRKEEWEGAIKMYANLTADKKSKFYDRAVEATAYCYFQKGDRKKAADTYFEIISGSKEIKLAQGIYVWVAEYYINAKNYERSIKTLDLLSKAYPEGVTGEVLYMYGENYLQTGDSGKAVLWFNKAIVRKLGSPYLERAYLGLGRAYRKEKKYKEAIDALEEALKTQQDNKTSAYIRFEIGNVRFEMKDLEEAAKQYMMVAILYEDEKLCSNALFRAGMSFSDAGIGQKAIDVFKELIERYPDNELSQKAKTELKKVESGSK